MKNFSSILKTQRGSDDFKKKKYLTQPKLFKLKASFMVF